MNYQHKTLASGRWGQLSFLEQMANIGSEVERAINWQAKNNEIYYRKAAQRIFELVDLTIDTTRKPSYYRELTRLREAFVDYFFYNNQFGSTPALWKSYFLHFTYAARKNC